MNSKQFDRLVYKNKFMQEAMMEAMESEAEGGIPIGSVIVKDEEIIGRSHNRRVQENNPILHAELGCIRDATKKDMNLRGAVLYTTHMPCYLCAGAIIQFGISKVIAGESETFPHARHNLEQNGIEVINLDIDECKIIIQSFVARNNKIWNGASENNSPRKTKTDGQTIIPYKKQGYVNFYQYPPPVKVSDKEKRALIHILDLNRGLSNRGEFTLFVCIPYCRSKCNSCPFFKNFISLNSKVHQVLDEYLQLLIKQIKNYAGTIRFSSACCGAVYVGGGTASLLSARQIQVLINVIKTSFRLKADAEITFEANPSDLNKKYLTEIKKMGVNRLSIGVQSFSDYILKKCLNSPHNSALSFQSIKNALDVGFKTINADLLYGVPGQTESEWHLDVKRMIGFAPQSITLYRYIIHPNSSSEKMIERGILKRQASEGKTCQLYVWAARRLRMAGYFEKRLGCFVKPGHEQKYSKLSYNLNCECIGIGAGAYGFINGYVFKASGDVKSFRRNIEKGMFQIGDHISVKATEKNKIERYIINNLFSGVLNQKDFQNFFGKSLLETFPFIFAKLWRYKLVAINNKYIKLTSLGKRYIQNILYEFYSEKFKNEIN